MNVLVLHLYGGRAFFVLVRYCNDLPVLRQGKGVHTVLQHIAGQCAALLITVAAKSQIVERDAAVRVGLAEGDIGACLIKQEEADALQRLPGIRVDF